MVIRDEAVSVNEVSKQHTAERIRGRNKGKTQIGRRSGVQREFKRWSINGG